MTYPLLCPEKWGDHYQNCYEYHTYLLRHCMYYTCVQNLARVAASFQCLADAGQLRVLRQSGYMDHEDYDDLVAYFHSTFILDANGNVVAKVCGRMCHNDNDDEDDIERNIKTYVEATKYRHDHRIEIELMIGAELMPNFPEFWDENEKPVDFTEEYGKSFKSFPIRIRREYVTDEFHKEPFLKQMEQRRKLRIMERCKTIKEELMINRWSPARVEKFLLTGYDIEDM